MSYTLSARQRRFYTHTADMYKPTTRAGNLDPLWPTTPTYSGVACHRQATPNMFVPEPMGRQKDANILTADVAHFHVAQEIADEWLLRITAGSGIAWYKVQGDPMQKDYRAQKLSVYLVETPTPSWAT